MSDPKTYLGDSVYAEFDGYHIILTTENGFGPSNTIALEPSVIAALNTFKQERFQEEQEPVGDVPERFLETVAMYRNSADNIERSLKRHGKAYEEVLDALKDVELNSESVDSCDLNIFFTGNKAVLEKVWGILRRLGFESPMERPAANQPEFTGRFTRDDKASVYMRFSSSVCRCVPTGKKLEIDEYEVRCD